jgi:glycosyltransferase involved in cell wall biosynthesis
MRALSEITEKKHYDLVIIEYWHNALLKSYVRKGARVVLLIHDAAYINDIRRLDVERNYLKKVILSIYFRFKRWEELRSIAKFHEVLALSSSDVSHIQKEKKRMSRTNFRTIPLTVIDKGEMDSCGHRDELIENSLYFLGSLNRFNNLDAVYYFLEEIYPHLENLIGEVNFFVVGSYKTTVEKRLKKLAPVHFVGYIDNLVEDLGRYKVCIAPLRVGSGIKIKILEAFVLGKPVVTTSIGAEGIDFYSDHPEGIRDNPRGFAEEVTRLFREDNYYNHVKEKQNLYACKNLTLESNHGKIQDIMTKIAMDGGRG